MCERQYFIMCSHSICKCQILKLLRTIKMIYFTSFQKPNIGRLLWTPSTLIEELSLLGVPFCKSGQQ